MITQITIRGMEVDLVVVETSGQANGVVRGIVVNVVVQAVPIFGCPLFGVFVKVTFDFELGVVTSRLTGR